MNKPLEVDIERMLVCVQGKPVHVAGRQLQLLLYLARRPNWVRTRDQLLKELWGAEGTNRALKSIDVVVCRLRRDLGVAGALVETVRPFGYRLREGETQS